jgi:hypothetical protein
MQKLVAVGQAQTANYQGGRAEEVPLFPAGERGVIWTWWVRRGDRGGLR